MRAIAGMARSYRKLQTHTHLYASHGSSGARMRGSIAGRITWNRLCAMKYAADNAGALCALRNAEHQSPPHDQIAVAPPSTGNAMPVVKPALSLHR